MYQSQQRSTDLCIDFYIPSTQDSFRGGYCLRSNLWILYEGGYDIRVPCVALGYTNPYAIPAATHLYTLPLRTYFIIPHLSGGCRSSRYRVFPGRRRYLLYSR
jgi:hypothetical protein